MRRVTPFEGPLKLQGFNNLTKALSFNLYDFVVARNEEEKQSYVQYIQQRFNAQKVTEVLEGICNIIEANVLAVSDQDYDPWGASSMVLMSDLKGGQGTSMHMDKSHICAHTYPDFQAGRQVCSFRIDIDIATCGEISPLKALNYMFEAFDADLAVIDYVVRGFTRDSEGRRIFMDHELNSIQDYISPQFLENFHSVDLVLGSENIWQTKMLRTNLNVDEYFLEPKKVSEDEKNKYMERIKNQMRGLLYMWPE
ncbi:MAG: adenosylmethionine decarboxylase [Zetaproteobacteria bacterium]|nr:adenosylmethionine decarboxylase [Pseudobdellovibrionaceae bacterium]|tara:strand:- start:683 stop:1441 length:759 start_codon:yes stop_codon:yes gene_type:complete